jgi:23S rRNA (cytosine1962-C5)-methyltransferase
MIPSLKSSVIIRENDILYKVNPNDGQKTGFYCDQRDNRRMIRDISSNKTILDTYCYSGGFSLNAAVGGAREIIGVDSSQDAIDTAISNAVLNKVDNKITFTKADALEYMKLLHSQNKLFDIVICDPPKLAPTRASLDRAKSKYIYFTTNYIK